MNVRHLNYLLVAIQSAFTYACLANPSIKPVIRVGFGYLHYYKIQYISRQVRFPPYMYCCLPKAWLGEILVSEFYSLTLPYLLRGTTQTLVSVCASGLYILTKDHLNI